MHDHVQHQPEEDNAYLPVALQLLPYGINLCMEVGRVQIMDKVVDPILVLAPIRHVID